MPITQTDLDEINDALRTGEKSVTINGKTVIYRSVDELIRARDDVARQLAEQQFGTSSARPRRVLLRHGGRGF